MEAAVSLRCLMVINLIITLSGKKTAKVEDIPDIIIHNVKVIDTKIFQKSESISQGQTRSTQSETESQDVAKDGNWPSFGNIGADLDPSKDRQRANGSRIDGFSMEELQDIIDDYGLYNLSSTVGKSSSQRFLLEMYKKLEDGEDLPIASGHTYLDAAILRADTVRSLPATDSKKSSSNKKITLTFDLSTISPREVTQRAELRIRPHSSQNQDGDSPALFRARVSVFDGEDLVKKLTYRIEAGNTTSDGFAVLDLTPIVKDVINAGYKHASISLTIKQLSRQRRFMSQDRRRRSIELPALSSNTNDAMLVIFTKDKNFFRNFRHQAMKRHLQGILQRQPAQSFTRFSKRLKRATQAQVEERIRSNQKVQCQRKDLIVDFNMIGWGEWIVYPQVFNAYQCSGKCPLPVAQDFDPTNHAVLQSLMRIRDRSSTSRPCCVPSKLKPMSMLYYEKDLIVVRHHEDMIVDKCGCR